MAFQTRHDIKLSISVLPQHLLFKITASHYRDSFTRFLIRMYKKYGHGSLLECPSCFTPSAVSLSLFLKTYEARQYLVAMFKAS